MTPVFSNRERNFIHLPILKLRSVVVSSPPITLILHGSRHLAEPSNIASSNQTWELTLFWLDILLRSLQPILEALRHDPLQLFINLLTCPLNPLRVLCHLQPRDCNTTCIRRFAGRIPDSISFVCLPVRLENVNCFLCTTHVAALGNEFGLGLDQTLGLFTGNFVLCRAWQCNVHVTNMQPWACSADILEATELVRNF